MNEAGFVLAAALAHASTNFDNLLLLLALSPVVGVQRAALAFVFAHTLVLAAAYAMGQLAGAASFGWTGWLGLLPIGLGLWTLWRQYSGDGQAEGQHATAASLPLATGLFLGLSADSFVVLAALFADSAGVYDRAVASGTALSIAAFAGGSVLLASRAARAGRIFGALERISPFVMIAVGLYILSDTATDLL